MAATVTTPRVDEYTSMSVAERPLFERVASECRIDAQVLCRANVAATRKDDAPIAAEQQRHLALRPPPVSTLSHPLPMLVTFHRSNPTPEDFDTYLNHLVQQAMRPPPLHLLMIVRAGVEEPRQRKPPCPFDTMMHQVANGVAPEHYAQLADHMNRKGQQLSEVIARVAPEPQFVEEHADHFSVSRRLQEVSPDALHEYRRSFLPFAPETADCLEAAYSSQQQVSLGCEQALTQLHKFREDEAIRIRKQTSLDENITRDSDQLWIYILCTAIFLAIRRRRIRKQQNFIGDRIFAAVYSKPTFKRKVEAELGHSVGHVPPIPVYRNLMRGKLRAAVQRWRRQIRAVCFVALATLAIVACYSPSWAMAIAACVARALFLSLVIQSMYPAQKNINLCVCCCCGGSTENVKLGTVTDAQACCPCCAGTGVCSVKCAACCSNTEEACSCCGGAGCCCCNGCTCSGNGTNLGGDGDAMAVSSSVECSCCKGCTCCKKCSCTATTVATASPPKSPRKRTVLSVDDAPAAYTGIPIQVV